MTEYFYAENVIIEIIIKSPHIIFGLVIPFSMWLRWIGVGLRISSLLFWLWVHHTLGKYWTIAPELKRGHQLITNGPYRWIRHPMYTAIFVFMTSIALISSNWFSVFSSITVIIVLSIRIPKEEAMMIEEFGDEYFCHMKRTGRLLPPLKRVNKVKN